MLPVRLYPSLCGHYFIKCQEYLFLVLEIQPTFATVIVFHFYTVSVIFRLHAVLIYEQNFISLFHYWGHLCFCWRHWSPPPQNTAAMPAVCFTLQWAIISEELLWLVSSIHIACKIHTSLSVANSLSIDSGHYPTPSVQQVIDLQTYRLCTYSKETVNRSKNSNKSNTRISVTQIVCWFDYFNSVDLTITKLARNKGLEC